MASSLEHGAITRHGCGCATGELLKVLAGHTNVVMAGRSAAIGKLIATGRRKLLPGCADEETTPHGRGRHQGTHLNATSAL
jgi:hypothetical protein